GAGAMPNGHGAGPCSYPCAHPRWCPRRTTGGGGEGSARIHLTSQDGEHEIVVRHPLNSDVDMLSAHLSVQPAARGTHLALKRSVGNLSPRRQESSRHAAPTVHRWLGVR